MPRNGVVLDMACGRGGDINKCIGCCAYYGVDIADDAVRELTRRAREVGVNAYTHVGCMMDALPWPTLSADVIVCNFALHYVCDSEQSCSRFLDNVVHHLPEYGVFCGTYLHVGNNDTRWGEYRVARVGKCVDGVPECVVPWKRVIQLAYSKGLCIIQWKPSTEQVHADPSCWTFAFRIIRSSQGCLTDCTLSQC